MRPAASPTDAGNAARRLRRLPVRELLGRRVPVARGPISRLLGLSHLDRRRAGAGLLLPRCSSVHTFGMRFALDLIFLNAAGEPIRVVRGVPPRRFVSVRGAAAVLELPAGGAPEGDGVLGNRHVGSTQGDANAAGAG